MAYAGYSKLQTLIVDDFNSFRMTVSKMLQDLGVQSVDSAVNGVEALRYCRSKAYDLILCDYNLGAGKNGQQILEELRHHKLLSSTALFILVSAESSKSIVLAAYDYEPDAYLTKPVTPKTLHQRLDRLLSQRSQMMAIHRALNDRQHDVAIALCIQEIERGSRCASQCQKLLGEIYLEVGEYVKAEELYREVLDVRELDWAQVGLARAKKGQGDSLSARQWLETVITNSPMCMKAYDVYAEICREQGDTAELQRILEQAVEISPLAILRQQQLGDVALGNNDTVTAATAYRRTVRLGENSCYDQPGNHLNFARATAALYGIDKNLAKNFSREANKSLGDLEQRFGKVPAYQLQAQLVGAQLSAEQGDKARAEQLLTEARKAMASGDLNYGIDTELDLVGAYRSLGDDAAAEKMVAELIEHYKGSEKDLEKIDRLLEEPVSAKNRQLVAKINNKGIACYEAGDYSGSVECFENALRTFPKHIGIRLNLIQALVDKLENQGADPWSLELAQLTLKEVADSITSTHDQFRRYRQLQERLTVVERSQAKQGD